MLRFDTVSTLVLSSISRQSIAESQRRLAEAQTEASTGRHHDVGLVLGARTAGDIRLRLQLSELTQTGELLSQGAARAGLTQSALASVSELAAKFLETLTGARGAESGQQIAADAARSALASLGDLINVTFDGQYVFGGTNTDVPPLRDFAGGPSLAIDAAFLSEFGVTQSDPSVSAISGGAMTAFLDGAFANVFSPAGWTANWSNASDINMRQRLGPGAAVDASANANAAFAPKLAQAFSMMMALGQNNLSDGAFTAAVDKAMGLIGEAQLSLGAEQSRIGIAQQRMTESRETIEKRKMPVTEALRVLESVDPYEAATRVNSLMTQLEASYAVTGRISRLSLLSYI